MHNINSEHIVRLYGVVLDTNALMLVSFLSVCLAFFPSEVAFILQTCVVYAVRVTKFTPSTTH